jgi:dihydroorotase
MTGERWLIHGGRIVDPASHLDTMADILIGNGVVQAVGADLSRANARIVDARGCIVAPGLIDLHVHLREPGGEAKETIATGTSAAAAGGFTAVCCMPNTTPPLDSVEMLRDLAERTARDARVKLFPIAAITVGRAGATPVDFAGLAAAGAIGFSDDGDTTRDSAIMRLALEASRTLERPVMVHCEDKPLASGAMHEGEVSRQLGISGLPAEAEEIIIARDLLLTRLTGGQLHVCHVSTARGATMILQAKREGVNVTAEVMPHHLLMDEKWVAGDRQLRHVGEPSGQPGAPGDPHTKVNPPLRTLADTEGLLAALQQGTFDVVATDHAPHAASEKEGSSFEQAAFGMSGSEFALPLLLALVRAERLSMIELVRRMTIEPARILRMPLGTLTPGAVADVVVFNPDEPWVVRRDALATKSANTPLLGMTLRGRVVLTLVDGEERYHA